jgi:dTDP-glucose 4,6-dehydratase
MLWILAFRVPLLVAAATACRLYCRTRDGCSAPGRHCRKLAPGPAGPSGEGAAGMRVLIAGCAGFIGCHLAERLLREGREVIGVDNFCSGSRANAERLASHAGFRLIEQDIVAPLRVDGPVERVYDLACPASPVDFARQRLGILATCSRGLWNLLDLARDKSARLLHASTSEVYGDPLEHPQRETYWGRCNPIGPRSCYDEGKRFGEALLVAYQREHGTPVRIPRIFNTYGPHMRADDGRALPTFIMQALRGEPVTIHGDGSQTRSFCYVTDLVDGLIRLMESDVSEPVNLGNPVEITVRQAAEEVIRLIGSPSQIVSTPRPGDDPSVRRPDITRAQTRLGWQPRVERAEGFRRTIEFFRGGR